MFMVRIPKRERDQTYHAAILLPGAPSCDMPPALQREGYEPNGDKYYKVYYGSEATNHQAATQRCNQVGATLAMFKNQADMDIVTGYQGKGG